MIVDEVVDSLPSDWDGILLIVTNPVDPLVTRAWRRTDIHRGRLLGYTLNDSLRLRTVIAKAAHVPPDIVEAWTIGEHGDLCVPVWDQVSVDGVPVDLDASVRADAEEGLRTWYVRHVALDSGRTSTWTSGLGVARMVAAMASDAGELWPASIVLDGEYGIADVALSVPVILGRRGVERIVRWTLTAAQDEMLGRAAQAVGELVRRVTLHADRRTQAVSPEP
jgi:malate dehydrogenase